MTTKDNSPAGEAAMNNDHAKVMAVLGPLHAGAAELTRVIVDEGAGHGDLVLSQDLSALIAKLLVCLAYVKNYGGYPSRSYQQALKIQEAFWGPADEMFHLHE
jgi:hypothetical protein